MTDGSPLEGTYEELGVVAWLLVDEDVRTVLLLGLYTTDELEVVAELVVVTLDDVADWTVGPK